MYSTNIFGVFRLAKHILSLNIDESLRCGDPLTVNKIATGHGVINNRNNSERNFYSFASKYCSWHNSDSYAIYDRFVRQVLITYRDQDNFCEFDDII